MSPRQTKILIAFTSLFLLYTLFGFFAVPRLANHYLTEAVNSELSEGVVFDEINFNPFTFEVRFKGIHISGDSGVDKASIGEFYANLQLWPIFSRQIQLADLIITAPTMQIYTDKAGLLNWQLAEQATSEKTTDNKPWHLNIEIFALSKGYLHIIDNTRAIPLDIELRPIAFHLNDFSTQIGQSSTLQQLTVQLGKMGQLTVDGQLSITPLAFKLDISASDLPLSPLSSFLSDTSYLEIQTGTADVNGTLIYPNPDTDGIIFNGASSIKNLAVELSTTEQEAFGWQQLDITDIVFTSSPLSVAINTINLSAATGQVIIREDGTLNVADFFKPAPAEESSSTDQTTAFQLMIEQIQLNKGSFLFSDQMIKPNFTTRIDNLQGSIKPVSLAADMAIVADLKGTIDTHGQVGIDIEGTPLAEAHNIKANLQFDNLEMTSFTPYSGRFAGYEIKQGKLYLTLKYHLQQGHIKGENELMLDQFILGDKVDSEDATSLPIKLAIALLKDREGKINISLPIEGDPNAPDFSVSHLVGTMIGNFISNIITAPFSFIGSLFGGGPDIEYLQFVSGMDNLLEGQQKKLLTLTTALTERPGLRVDIQGMTDQNKDRQALQDLQYNNMLAVHRELSLLYKSLLSEQAYQALVLQFTTTAAATDEAPNPVATLDQPALEQAMKDAVYQTIVIEDERLKQLAFNRGRLIQTALVEQGIAAERLFVLSGKIMNKLQKDAAVHLTLK